MLTARALLIPMMLTAVHADHLRAGDNCDVAPINQVGGGCALGTLTNCLHARAVLIPMVMTTVLADRLCGCARMHASFPVVLPTVRTEQLCGGYHCGVLPSAHD